MDKTADTGYNHSHSVGPTQSVRDRVLSVQGAVQGIQQLPISAFSGLIISFPVKRLTFEYFIPSNKTHIAKQGLEPRAGARILDAKAASAEVHPLPSRVLVTRSRGALHPDLDAKAAAGKVQPTPPPSPAPCPMQPCDC